MSAEKTEHGTTKGLAIIVAAVVVFAAIVGASAVVAKKPAPRGIVWPIRSWIIMKAKTGKP